MAGLRQSQWAGGTTTESGQRRRGLLIHLLWRPLGGKNHAWFKSSPWKIVFKMYWGWGGVQSLFQTILLFLSSENIHYYFCFLMRGGQLGRVRVKQAFCQCNQPPLRIRLSRMKTKQGLRKTNSTFPSLLVVFCFG